MVVKGRRANVRDDETRCQNTEIICILVWIFADIKLEARGEVLIARYYRRLGAGP